MASDFVPVTTGWRTATSPVVLIVPTTLTTTPVVTAEVNLIGWEYAHIRLAYVKGSETTARFYVELYDGTNWTVVGLKNSPSSGLSDVTKDVVTLTPANYAASDSVLLPPISVLGFQTLRGYIYYNGGVSPGTLGVTVTASITVKR